MYIDGGITIQRFLRAGCIDELIITVIPVLLGQGRRLFGEVEEDVRLQLIKSHTLNGGFVHMHYKII